MRGKNPPAPVVEDLDSADLDAIKEMIRSRGYGLVVERVKAEIERLRLDLENGHGADEWLTNQLRGQIKAYRTLLTIPGILRGEIERKVKA